MTPEQEARKNIDKMLSAAGWTIQDVKSFNPAAGIGIAVREYQTENGPADYVLFVNREPVGVIEAKKEGTLLSQVEDQTEKYANSRLKWKVKSEPLRFLYQSTGVETRFTDNADPVPRARDVFYFHKPVTLVQWLKEPKSLRKRLKEDFPILDKEGLRDCQYKAIFNLENSFGQNKPKALIQMATGAGKTITAINATYRLLKFAKAKRIIFLVDTKNLGEQTEREFQAFTPLDDKRKFNELYNVQRLKSGFIDKDAQVCISTIQRMYSILRGEEMDESAEEISLNEIKLVERPKEVAYNSNIPIETFDFIIIDECHRSIYNLWKQVLEYFDGFLIGLTATPDSRTFGFFDKNIVSEYTYEQSVVDGVNVAYDVFTIETEITKNGSVIEAGQWVDKRNRQTRQKTWEQTDEVVEYGYNHLDKEVVNPDQIRTIIRTFKERLSTQIFPNRKEAPKTLIFAKTDSHAEDIIKIVREEFNEGNAFCKKVTYGNTEEKASEVLQQFRTAYNPRIAVTVDMIATGTDVKPIECLLFMRDVKSRSYFEQMKGRGTRVLSEDDLKKVTPSALSSKTHFVIVDAVGVCKSIKTDSRPLERKPSVSFKDLMMNVVMGQADEDTVTSLANRLVRLEKQITSTEREKIKEFAAGKTINQIAKNLLDAYNPDKIEAIKETIKTAMPEATPDEIEEKVKENHQQMIRQAVQAFDSPDLRTYLETVKKSHDQIIDVVNTDVLLQATWDGQAEDKAKATISNFKEYIEAHKDVITALQIFYSQPFRRKELTYSIIKQLYEKLKMDKPILAPSYVWNAYRHLEKVNGNQPKNELIALVSLIRRVLEIDPELTPYDVTVNRNFQKWVFGKQEGTLKFNSEQMEWLRMMKDYIASSIHLDKEDFELSPFNDKGGLMRCYQLFGNNMDNIIDELNGALTA